jgi:tRNA nucleotidyltransferase (CCA-adding enzyme)
MNKIIEQILKIEPKITPADVQELLKLEVWLVGGAVRDLLLGLEPKDYDFSTPAGPDEVVEAIQKAGYKPYLLGQKFGTIGFKFQYAPKRFEYIEITTFRKESYIPGSRKPDVEFVQDMILDMSRRDFTINAMAIGVDGILWDEFGGLEDLKNGIVRAVGQPKPRFKEDPLRILRAVRFAAKYNFELEEQTAIYCAKMAWSLLTVSKERWVIELDKILGSVGVRKGLNLLMDLKLFKVMMPYLELQKGYDQNSPWHDFELWEHTLNVVENVPAKNIELRWVGLLHDIAKPMVRVENPKGHSNYMNHEILGAQIAGQLCSYLKFSKARTDYIVSQIHTHLDPDSDLKIYDDGGKKIIKNQEESVNKC